MKITDLDYYARFGNTWFHKIPIYYKFMAILIALTLILLPFNYIILGIAYVSLLAIILVSKLPRLKILVLSLYPLSFIILYFLSIKNLSYELILLVIFKVILISTLLVLLTFTTPYTEIFHQLGKFLPAPFVSFLFLTYRSVFVLWIVLENLQQAMYIRGIPKLSHPVHFFRSFGNALGHLVIRSIDISESMYEAMNIRGYSGSLKYLDK